MSKTLLNHLDLKSTCHSMWSHSDTKAKVLYTEDMKILDIIGFYEFKDWSILRRLFAELIGTFLLIAILIPGLLDMKDTVKFALAIGLTAASIIAYIGHISGGHINPAVTVGFLVCNYIKLLPAICYVLAQIAGGILGQLVARCIHKREVTIIPNNFNVCSAFCVEVLATFLLVSVAASVSDPRRYSRGIGSAALAIGLCIAAPFCAIPVYRCHMNPAAALAISVFLNSFDNLWVVSAGPLVGGLLAGLIYRIITTNSRTIDITPRIQINYT